MGTLEQRDIRGLRLADVVQFMRSNRGVSARALSLEAGLSPSYVSKLEAGEIEPSVRAFGRLALVLGMNQQEMFLVVTQESLRESPKKSKRLASHAS